MEAAALSHLKRSLSNGFESLPESAGKHRTFSYAGTEYLVRTLAADPTTIARLMSLERADHHLPELVTFANHTYEVQQRLPKPTLTDAPLRTFEEARTAYERVWNAIGACHEAGIGHGDVHPGNILYRDGDVTVIDWEWARAKDAPSRVPRLDLAHYDYAGLMFTGRELFLNYPNTAEMFPRYRGPELNFGALERTVSRISDDLQLPRLS